MGLIAVTLFGFTLPMTHLAVTELDPVIVGLGRALLASFVAALILWINKDAGLKPNEVVPLLIVALCISIPFPLLTACAMRTLPASHGAIVIGLLPVSTSIWIGLMKHEKPSVFFWLASILGAVTVVGISIIKSGGVIQSADLLLLLTVVCGGLGYASGAVLAKKMGGMRVMSWALVYAMPVLALGVILHAGQVAWMKVSWNVWIAFIYLSLISQYFGMAIWYKALSLGSVVRVSQVQLIQPFITLTAAAVFFKERIDLLTGAAAFIVLCCIQLSRMTFVEIKHQKNSL